jgi:hypothetical protein
MTKCSHGVTGSDCRCSWNSPKGISVAEKPESERKNLMPKLQTIWTLNLFVCTPWRHEGVEVYLHSFWTLKLRSDCGVYSWPWHWFALGKVECILLVSSSLCIPVKNTLGWSAVVFCACEIIQLCPVVFYIVRAVHKFYLRLVINEYLTNGHQWKKVMK